MDRLRQLAAAFRATREVDDRLLPYVIGAALLGFAIPFVVGWLLGSWIAGLIGGLLVAPLAALSVFGRRAERAQLHAIEGQPGAAAAVLQSLRGTWFLIPAVAFTRKQDLVHLVVGRPGAVLVGEGSRARVGQLLEQEAKKVGRAAGDAPVHTISVGVGEDQVPLNKLRGHVMRLSPALKKDSVRDLNRRLEALAQKTQPQQQMPKGPIPRGRQR